MSMLQYVIYESPLGYDGLFVCRVWHGDVPEAHPWALSYTLDEMRAKLPAGLSYLGREHNHEPAICEVWA